MKTQFSFYTTGIEATKMAKKKISLKRKRSSSTTPRARIKDFAGIHPHYPEKNLKNPKFVGAALLECLQENDPEGVMEVLEIYLSVLNKSQLAREEGLHRQTLYSAFKRRNPTVRTLAKIVHAFSV
jgi:DNA-binding phage protein